MGGHQNTYVSIVDDDENHCRSLSRLLRAANFQPVIYHSPEAFLEDQKRPQFDCILLDIYLGEMSGIELSRQLALAGSTIPVVFITAHDTPEMRAQANATGCAGYFRKTDPGTELLDTIRRAVAVFQGAAMKTDLIQTKDTEQGT